MLTIQFKGFAARWRAGVQVARFLLESARLRLGAHAGERADGVE